jgi:hypothetical protein
MAKECFEISLAAPASDVVIGKSSMVAASVTIVPISALRRSLIIIFFNIVVFGEMMDPGMGSS